jgi:hypothetical protein
MPRIVILHYHFEPGGVTTVVRDGVISLLKKRPEWEIVLISGRKGPGEALATQILSRLPEANVQHRTVSELDYAQDEPDSGYLSRLYEDYSDALWWSHNHSLGKNPFFTRDLLKLAMEHSKTRFIFQIHDFPECGRFQNLQRIKSAIHESQLGSLYPVAENIFYSVINTRDFDLLKEAGLPQESGEIFYNPVHISQNRKKDPEHSRKVLEEAWGIPPAGRLLIYPVRAIRRKNVLEAAFLSLISESYLLVTLPGQSSQEKPYSDLCESVFEGIPGKFRAGEELDALGLGFDDFLCSADRILSSSIQEGFGYMFLQALQEGIGLFAKKLDILDGMPGIDSTDENQFYDKLCVPLKTSEIAALRSEYRDYLMDLGPIIGSEAQKLVESRLKKLFDGFGDLWDFSYLSIELQAKIIKVVKKSPEYKNEVQGANRNTIHHLQTEYQTEKSDISSAYGEEAYAERIIKTIESPWSSKQGSLDGKIIQDRFLRTEYFRLLYKSY